MLKMISKNPKPNIGHWGTSINDVMKTISKFKLTTKTFLDTSNWNKISYDLKKIIKFPCWFPSLELFKDFYF